MGFLARQLRRPELIGAIVSHHYSHCFDSWGWWGENHYIQGAFVGIKAAVCGLILISAVKLGKQILKGPFQWILAVAAFLAIGVFGITASMGSPGRCCGRYFI